MNVQDVGAQDPELHNSPIAEEALEEDPTLRQQVGETDVCYFNDEVFENGTIVQSGTTLLRCDRGLWVSAGSSDPDNP